MSTEEKFQELVFKAEPDSLTIYLDDKSVFVYKMDGKIAATLATRLMSIYNAPH